MNSDYWDELLESCMPGEKVRGSVRNYWPVGEHSKPLRMIDASNNQSHRQAIGQTEEPVVVIGVAVM